MATETIGVSNAAKTVPGQIQNLLLTYLDNIQVSGDYLNQVVSIYPDAEDRVTEIQQLLNDTIALIAYDDEVVTYMLEEANKHEILIDAVLAEIKDYNADSTVGDSTNAYDAMKDEADSLFSQFNFTINNIDNRISTALTQIVNNLNTYRTTLSQTPRYLRISRNTKTVEALSQLSGSANSTLDKLIKNVALGERAVISALFGETLDSLLEETKDIVLLNMESIRNALTTEDSSLLEVVVLDVLRDLPLSYADYLPSDWEERLRNNTWVPTQ